MQENKIDGAGMYVANNFRKKSELLLVDLGGSK